MTFYSGENYGGGKVVRAKNDSLAYILMLDIECTYTFSTRFAPNKLYLKMVISKYTKKASNNLP